MTDSWGPEPGPYAQWLTSQTGLPVGHVAIDEGGKWCAFCPMFYHLQNFPTRDEAKREVERVLNLKREAAAVYAR